MESSSDRDRIERITAEVLAELRELEQRRAGGRAPGGVATLDPPRGGITGTLARIRPYGAPAPAAARAPDSSSIVLAADLKPASFAMTPGTAARAALAPEEVGVSPSGLPTATCNVSNRHIHLTREDFEVLFGPGAELTPRNHLMQPGQFASEQTVSLIAGRGRTIENVRILGPLRRYTQVEISRTDGFFLGIRPPVRASSNIKGSAGGTLVGPKGTLVLKEGIIIADRHVHAPPAVAKRFGLANDQMIKARAFHSDKPTVLERVRIRIDEEFVLEMHLDTDDANACGISSGDRLEMIF